MKSTIGFAPIVKKTESRWHTEEGKETFVEIVKEKVSDHLQMPVTIEDKEEVIDILRKTLFSSEADDEHIMEAINYAVSMLVNRFRHQERLQSISDNMIRLQPRGQDDREKGCMQMAEVKNHGSMYSQFLQNQQKFRH